MGFFSSIVKVAVIVAAVSTGVGMLTGAVAGGAAFSAAGLTYAAGTAAAYFATSFVTTLVLGTVSYALSKGATNGTALSGGALTSTRDGLAPHRVIYGRSRLGGTIVYLESTQNNKYLHVVLAIAGHEIDAIEKVYFNDDEVTVGADGIVTFGGSYANKARVKYKLGTETQTAFEDLVAESDGNWTTDHRMKGIAAVYIRLEYDSNVYPNGMPNFTFLVRGKKVYDPRTSTTAWSTNPALCVADYLTNDQYGFGAVYADEIDEDALIASADICEIQTPLAAPMAYEDKYSANGFFTTSSSPNTVINQLLTSMAGKAVWTQGKWRILAGAYTEPTLTFDEDDLRGGFTVQSFVSRRENFNCVKGIFVSSINNYISTDFPPLISNTYIAEDGGEAVYKNIALPFTTSASTAQRLAKIDLLRARQQITLTMPMKLTGMKANVGDIVAINNTRMGWDAKTFEVVSINIALGETIGVDLELREISSNVYDWDAEEEQAFDAAPNTSLPNPFSVSEPTNFSTEAIGTIKQDGTYKVDLKATWDDPESLFLDYFVIRVRDEGDTIWYEVRSETNSYMFYDVAEGSYDIEIYAVSINGVSSTSYSTTITVAGDTTAPSAPTGITITDEGYQSAYIKWTNPSDYDYNQTIVYASTTNDSSTATEVGRLRGTSLTYSGLEDGVTYYIWLRAIDYSGNESALNTSQYAGTSFTTAASVAGGLNSATVFLFKKNTTSSTPSLFSGTFTYTFSTGLLSGGTLNGWTQTAPTLNQGDYLFVTTATASSTNLTDTIDSSEFATPSIVGIGGTDGTDGAKTAIVTLFNKNTSSSSAPASFTGTFTYTFSTAVLSGGTLNGWSQTAPSLAQGEYLWSRQATAYNTTTTDSISYTEFSSAVVVGVAGNDGADGLDGADGANGADGATGATGISFINAYKVQDQSLSAPSFSATTSGSAVPTGWSSTAPSVSVGQILWYIQGRYNGSSITIDGVSSNTTAWTGPIASSVFQDIRSDNWNGSNPPTTTYTTWGTAGYYIAKEDGNMYANGFYARGKMRIEGNNNDLLSTAARFNQNSAANIGVYSYGNQTAGRGVVGVSEASSGVGVVGSATSASARAGVLAFATSGAPTALEVSGGAMVIDNSTLVTNLNADMVDGKNASDLVQVASGTTNGKYLYYVNNTGAPSNPSTIAAWILISTNDGGAVYIPGYL